MSKITKNALAMALKKLLARRTLTGITVQNIVDEAGVSRKTFYYHFKDIYDLMEWTLQEEFQRIMAENMTLDNWEKGMENLLDYIQENKILVLNLMDSMDDAFFTEQLRQVVSPLIRSLLQELPGFRQQSEEDQQFFTLMQVYGGVGILLDWIREGMPVSRQTILVRLRRYVDLVILSLKSSDTNKLPEESSQN